jgi:hypothetical protein
MAQLSISLSRAHKIAERIKTRMGELFSEAAGLAAVQNVTGVSGDAQVAKLSEQGARALEVFGRAEKFSAELAALRARIGAENQERGVNAMLARLEGYNRIVANLKALINQGKAAGITPAELAGYKPLTESSRFGAIAVSVVVLKAEQLAQLEQRLAQVQREAFALSDQIAEANAARFTVELADDIAAEVTGA